MEGGAPSGTAHDFTGYLQGDGYAGYAAMLRDDDSGELIVPDERRLGCGMHIRAKFEKAAKIGDARAAIALAYFKGCSSDADVDRRGFAPYPRPFPPIPGEREMAARPVVLPFPPKSGERGWGIGGRRAARQRQSKSGGTETATAHFIPYDHLPGGVVIWPRSQQPADAVSLTVAGQALHLSR